MLQLVRRKTQNQRVPNETESFDKMENSRKGNYLENLPEDQGHLGC